MSIYKSSSLAMIPTAYKDGKLYSVRPNDGDGDFTFSRGSNLAATRVDVNGLIEKGRENVMPYSQDFTNAQWVAFNATKTTNQSDPNGGSTAVRVVSTAVVNSGLYVFDTTNFGTNKIRTASVWMKGAVGGEVVQMGDATNRVSVTLTTEWVRYEAYAIDASTYFVLYSNSTAQTWDVAFAQYEDGLVATDYIETTSSTAQAGILEDMPRLDYSGGASCPALLLEPQRSNLITQSEYVDSWLKHNCTIDSNIVVSPEGKQNAHKIVENTSLGYHAVYLNNVFTADGTYKTASVFVKAAGRDFCAISTRGAFGSNDKTLIFNLTNGEWAVNGSGQNTGLDAEDFGDGWWRIVLNTNTTSAAYDGFIVGAAIAGDTWADAEYTGDGTSGIYVYGAQVETGSYPTSYIPTYGASVTRSVEQAESDLSNTSTGHRTIFIDSRDFFASNGIISFRNSEGSTIYAFYSYSDHYNVYNGERFCVESSADGTGKIVLQQIGNDIKIFVNGVDNT